MDLNSRSYAALVIDDDQEFNLAFRPMLQKLGVIAQCVDTAERFFEKIKKRAPEICFIDLDISKTGEGFGIVEWIRKTLGSEIVVFVVSARTDPQSIAHAIEVGANDYIQKPVDPEILASKLATHLASSRFDRSKLEYFKVPLTHSEAEVLLGLEMVRLDEFGVTVKGKYLLSKGSILEIRGPLMESITKSSSPTKLTVTKTWIERNEKETEFYAFLEFDSEDIKLVGFVRSWIVSQK